MQTFVSGLFSIMPKWRTRKSSNGSSVDKGGKTAKCPEESKVGGDGLQPAITSKAPSEKAGNCSLETNISFAKYLIHLAEEILHEISKDMEQSGDTSDGSLVDNNNQQMTKQNQLENGAELKKEIEEIKQKVAELKKQVLKLQLKRLKPSSEEFIPMKEEKGSLETNIYIANFLIPSAQGILDKVFKDLEQSEDTSDGSSVDNNDRQVTKQNDRKDGNGLAEENKKLRYENEDLKKILQRIRSKTSEVPIQILTQGGEIATHIRKELDTMLSARLDTKSKHVCTLHVNSYEQVCFDVPLLVICIVSSRLGTDAKRAIKDIPDQGKNKTALIMFHHNEEHALPKQSSGTTLSSDEFKQLGAICDMAFLNDEGIYICDLNDKALDKIITFIENA